MVSLVRRDVQYSYESTPLIGLVRAPAGLPHAPSVLLVHDAFGLNEDTVAIAERLAAWGYAVFAADVWGNRTTPSRHEQIGPLIGAMLSNRVEWMGRMSAARDAAAAQPEIDIARLVALGFCFGGSSALEYLRTGGDLIGAVSVHGGLDLLAPGWGGAPAGVSVLLCTGADDPMATAAMRDDLQRDLSAAEVDWEVDLYSDTRHGFTNPKSQFAPAQDVVGYNPRSADRAWRSVASFLAEVVQRASEPQIARDHAGRSTQL